jgi:hypothetical protein
MTPINPRPTGRVRPRVLATAGSPRIASGSRRSSWMNATGPPECRPSVPEHAPAWSGRCPHTAPAIPGRVPGPRHGCCRQLVCRCRYPGTGRSPRRGPGIAGVRPRDARCARIWVRIVGSCLAMASPSARSAGEVVLGAQPVVVHPGRLGHVRVDSGGSCRVPGSSMPPVSGMLFPFQADGRACRDRLIPGRHAWVGQGHCPRGARPELMARWRPRCERARLEATPLDRAQSPTAKYTDEGSYPFAREVQIICNTSRAATGLLPFVRRVSQCGPEVRRA